jgi:hypothetical protein
MTKIAGCFYGCKSMLLFEPAALLAALGTPAGIVDAADGAERDGPLELDGVATSTFELLHAPGADVHVGPVARTHVHAGLAVKRSDGPMAVEAAIHAAAQRACPRGVARLCAYVGAPGRAASALVTRDAGCDGYRFLRRAPPVADCLGWLEQVAGTVGALCGAGIVHGDLKLNNTCRDDAGAWRVIDFGLSALARDADVALCEHGTRGLYGDAPPLNASFDLRVLLWSCTLHARTPGPWDHWASRFECEYPGAWRLLLVARSCSARERPRALTRALHAMYQPVYRRHDAEFEPLRVLDSLRLLRGEAGEAARAEAQRLAAADAPRG